MADQEYYEGGWADDGFGAFDDYENGNEKKDAAKTAKSKPQETTDSGWADDGFGDFKDDEDEEEDENKSGDGE